jgi:hypothetical protein
LPPGSRPAPTCRPQPAIGYAINWNAGIQHTFANDYTPEIRYVGTKGVHLLFQNQINRNSLVSATNNLATYMQMPSQATLDSLQLTPAALAAIRATCPASGANYQNCSPLYDPIGQYGFVNAITEYAPLGNSHYHGLVLDLKKRYSKNLLFDSNYTWSHNIDDSTGEVASIIATPRRPEDFNTLGREKANSALDRRYRFTLTTVYTVPLFSGSKNPVRAEQPRQLGGLGHLFPRIR